jgi:hypothetical protein
MELKLHVTGEIRYDTNLTEYYGARRRESKDTFGKKKLNNSILLVCNISSKMSKTVEECQQSCIQGICAP